MAAKPAAKKTKTPAKPAEKRRPGAPSIYTEELGARICAMIAEGKTLRQITATEGMPSMFAIMSWLGRGDKPGFNEQYARAHEARSELMAEELLAIADDECTMIRADKHGSRDDDGQGNTEVVFDSVAVARNRLRYDARKWLMSKMAPKKYGDRVATEVTGGGGGPLEVAILSKEEFKQARREMLDADDC